MLDVDIAVVWPATQDYPLFRHNLTKIKKYFKTLNIYFTENYSARKIDDFIKYALKEISGVTFFQARKPLLATEDWADVAFREIFNHTSSKWFMSLHPDIFFRDWGKLFTTLEKAEENDLIGFPYVEKIISPYLFLMKRESLKKTCLDFSAYPDEGYDHWGFLSRDAQKLGMKIKTLSELGFKTGKDVLHLGGVSQDFDNGLKPGYTFPDPKKFFTYLYWSLKVPVKFDHLWLSDAHCLLTLLKDLLPDFNLEDNQWSQFLKREVEE